ncbi:uncharacterized protein V6R79_002522, partial [Siganus canaliculatus]
LPARPHYADSASSPSSPSTASTPSTPSCGLSVPALGPGLTEAVEDSGSASAVHVKTCEWFDLKPRGDAGSRNSGDGVFADVSLMKPSTDAALLRSTETFSAQLVH